MRYISLFVAASLLHGVAEAAIIADPGLTLGSQFRVVFVTADRPEAGGLISATSSDIGVYNTFVNTIGETLTWEGVAVSGWTAIVSTPTVDAIDNTSTPTSVGGVSVFRIDGPLVAMSYSALWSGSLLAPIAATPDFGSTTNLVWTGSLDTGRAAPGLTLGAGSLVRSGHHSLSGSAWIDRVSLTASVNRAVYGISPVLTVGGASSPVPEPSAFLLFALCSAGGCFAHDRRKRKVLEHQPEPNSATA